MDDLLSLILPVLSKINPLWALAAVVAISLFGGKLKALLPNIKLPSLTPAAPVAPDLSDPKALDKWLEAHPLLDRLWKVLKEKYSAQVVSGVVSEDDAYVELLKALKDKK